MRNGGMVVAAIALFLGGAAGTGALPWHPPAGPRHVLLAVGVAAGLLAAAVAIVERVRPHGARPASRPTRLKAGQVAVTIGALVCTGVGLNTAWGFTHSHLGISDLFTRAALCGTGEIVLVSLGLAARDNLRTQQRPGAPGTLVWVITAFLAVPAFAEASSEAHGAAASLAAGIWRAVFGPIAAAWLWHLAMGLEIRQADATARSNSIAARILRHWGQQLLAWLAIPGDRDATAAELARERARVHAANLTDRYDALPEKAKRRRARLRRKLRAALRAAGVAHDPTAKRALLDDLAVSAHAAQLPNLDHPSPWATAAEPAEAESAATGVTPPSATTATEATAPAQPARTVAQPDGAAEVPFAQPGGPAAQPGGATTGQPASTPVAVQSATTATGVAHQVAPDAYEVALVAATATHEMPETAEDSGSSAELPRNHPLVFPQVTRPDLEVVRNSDATPTQLINEALELGLEETALIRNFLVARGAKVPTDSYIRRLRSEKRNPEGPAEVAPTGTGPYL